MEAGPEVTNPDCTSRRNKTPPSLIEDLFIGQIDQHRNPCAGRQTFDIAWIPRARAIVPSLFNTGAISHKRLWIGWLEEKRKDGTSGAEEANSHKENLKSKRESGGSVSFCHYCTTRDYMRCHVEWLHTIKISTGAEEGLR